MKVCCRCKAEKPMDEFGINRATSDGRQYACKECIHKAERPWSKRSPEHRARQTKLHIAKDAQRRQDDPVFRESRLESTRKYRANNPETVKIQAVKHRLAMKYNLSVEGKEALMEKQNGLCALCRHSDGGKRGLFVDHDHETGEVRGLLCVGCNAALGMLGDNVEGLQNAIAYLQGKNSQQQFQPLTFVA